ncbi:MAG: beta-Ala-His dipeptidase [Candidatus Hermodarchaeota archaeon]
MVKTDLSRLSPSLVWQIFEDIIKIPRCSKKEEKIRAWVKKWAKNNDVLFKEDESGNILLRQEGSLSFEERPTLILQGHMDMVCQKAKDFQFDFDTDPINAFVDESGEFVTAESTTLGADNGIGVSMCLASLIDPEIKHGPLEVLLTVDEETGLTGAFSLKPGFFTGKYLLNLDSEDLGVITVSSAGGGDTEITLDCQTEDITDLQGFELTIKGLTGGHSGTDIHLGRLNAIKTLGDGLSKIKDNNLQLNAIVGGKAHNAIPLDASSKFFVRSDRKEAVHQILTHWKENIEKEVSEKEPGIIIELNPIPNEKRVFSQQTTAAILDLILQLPHGPAAYSKEIPDLVETSTNLATIKSEANQVKITLSTRSAKNDELAKARNKIKDIAEKLGASVVQENAYPGWYSDLNAPFLNLVKQKYEKVLGKEVQLKAIHAGLECGLFTALDPELQIVAMGPDIKDGHSTKERVYIESVALIWKIVKEIIESLGEL